MEIEKTLRQKQEYRKDSALRWANERKGFLNKQWDERGSNLSDGQRTYLLATFTRDVVWTTGDIGRLKQEVEFPIAMDDALRQRKKPALEKLRSALNDLAMMTQTTAPSYRPENHTPWFDMDDARSVFDKRMIGDILDYAMRHFGSEYADEFLNRLGAYYFSKGEEIVVQRKIGHFGPGI
jgi:hypothetical protein